MTDLEQHIEAALPMVKSIAQGLYNTLPNCVSVSDLIQEGVVGLMKAARSIRICYFGVQRAAD